MSDDMHVAWTGFRVVTVPANYPYEVRVDEKDAYISGFMLGVQMTLTVVIALVLLGAVARRAGWI